MMTAARAILCGAALCLAPLWVAAQTSDGGLAGLYQGIISGSENGQPPTKADVTGYLKNVPAMSPDDIRTGLPWIQKALENPNVEVRHYAGLGILAIDRRPDSRSLIETLVPLIARQLLDPDINTRVWAISALAEMKPAPPDEAISSVLQDLKTDDQLAPGIVFELVQIDPNQKDIAAGIADYMSSRMNTTNERIETLDALGTRSVQDPRLISLITDNLTSQSNDLVRMAAIQALDRSGPVGIDAARPQLQKLAESPEISDVVRSAAKQALESTAAKNR
jgi:HEAT repeat protein